MPRNTRLLESVFAKPWALHGPVYRDLCGVVLRHAEGEKLSEEEIQSIVEARSDGPIAMVGGGEESRRQLRDRGYVRRGAVGVIPIGGLIAPHANMVNGCSQPRGTGIDSVRQGLANMLADWRAGEVGAGLLHIESPGGYVGGVEALAQDIANARAEGFTIHTLATDMLCSAAFWIGSQAERLYAESQTTDIGSLGVIVGRADISRWLANEGVGVEYIRSGPLKALGQTEEAMSEAERRQWQELVDNNRDTFIRDVARGRGVSESNAREWATGQAWPANTAPAGMHDGVRSAKDVLGELQQIASKALSTRDRSAVAGHDNAKATERNLAMPPTAPNTAATDPNAGGAGNQPTNPTNPANPSNAAGSPGSVTPDSAGAATAAIAAERERTAAIMTRAAAFAHVEGVAALAQAAVADGRSAEAFGNAVLDKLGSTVPPVTGAGADMSVGTEQQEKLADAMTLALVLRGDPSLASRAARGGAQGRELAQAVGFDDETLLAKAVRELTASGQRGMRLMDMATRCAEATGQSFVRHDINSTLAVAFGSGRSDLPNIFGSAMNRMLLAAGAATPTVFDKVCYIGAATDFRDQNLLTMSAFPDLDLVPSGDKPKEASVSDRAEAIRVLTYGKKLGWTREMVVNDDLGAMVRILQMIGRAIRRKPDLLLAAAINANANMNDGNALFSTAHRNLAGSGAAPSQATIQAMITAMKTQRSFGKGAAVIEPVDLKMILCPAALEFAVSKYEKNQNDPDSSTANVSNQVSGRFETVPFPELDNYSATAWYGVADPAARVLFQMNFLQGNRNGTVTRVGDGSILGINFEVIHDCGVKSVEFEAGYKNPGA